MPLTTSPAIAEDYLFAGGESGTVYALGPAPPGDTTLSAAPR
ncbi:hypothetical protein DU484_12150 [Haloplanus rubicundus]|uniref:Uncharacterized protein n=1 Tax=Haloplanus rubicundus TaxID=1547898 RepID=A0A345EEB2_9EURY|nr:hypothetical protein DU484_12150 [Haloplanus rubicundus]